jgi:hypothetical protein
MNKIRKYFFEKFGIYDFLDLFPYSYRMYYYDNILPIFKPRHERLRKVIPRTWRDISSLLVDVNFEFVKSFYEDEYKQNQIDWSSSEEHKNFEDWLIKSYRYITVERPILQKRMEESYPPLRPFVEMFKPITDKDGRKLFQMVDDGIPYEVKYKKVNELEKEISEKDTNVLTELIKYREFLWT